MKIQITDGRLLDPGSSSDRTGNVYIADGNIVSCGDAISEFTADVNIDARGKWVCPGLVDLAFRFGEAGQMQVSLDSEANAAATAGVTSVCCPPDVGPIIDTPAAIELINRRAAKSGKLRVFVTGALTHGLKGERLAEMHGLKQAGCVAVGNASWPLVSNEILRRAFEYAASTDLTVFIQPEDPSLRNQGVVNEGEISTRLGLAPVPETAETVAVATALLLIEQTGVQTHFCRLSSARAVRMIAEAKRSGLPVSADAGISHLFLTEQDVDGYNSNCHLQPPLRRMEDRQALVQGLIDGSIDAICSDHTPLSDDAKMAPFNLTRPGASTIEMLLPLVLDLAAHGRLDVLQALRKVTVNPARILGQDSGTLAAGRRADLIIIDPDHQWTVIAARLASAGKNTPFANWELIGKVSHTLLDGNIIWQN